MDSSYVVAKIMDYALSVFMGAAVVAASLPLVHILQLESYQGKMYLKWLSKHIASDFLPSFIAGAAALIFRIGFVLISGASPLAGRICYYLADIIYIAMLAIIYFSYEKRPHAKPIVYTGRVKRLLIIEFIAAVLFSAMFFSPLLWEKYGFAWLLYLPPLVVRYLPGLILPLFLFACHLITYPIEEGVKLWYLNDAKRMLKEHDELIRIGITGSYGKTGAKYALGEILAQKYTTLITPGSFNTPMGVTRTIREQLNDSHQVFVAEMGARYTGDIKTLCRLVRPQYGIITAVGKQHLETFKTLDNIINTKAELAQGIEAGGCCFLNGDDENCRKIYARFNATGQLYLYGTKGEGLYMKAANITVTNEGSAFELIAQNGDKVSCSTQLLGRHNILNLTAAAALAYKLGLTLDEIAAGIANARPVEHRLQLIPGVVTVIDDAFNSNPVGSKEALKVLGAYKDKKRIVVTPGMVELGAEEAELNREFGHCIAENADIAIIIGKAHADPICQGILEKGFAQQNLIRVGSLKEATEKLAQCGGAGSVVLFENDLPDNYNE